MPTAYIALGKSGDVLSALPILYNELKRTGKAQILIVAKQYASVVEGIDYVQPVIWDGDWQDFNGAYAWAKKQFSKVIPLSTYGKEITIQHKSPSWQLDQWLRSGIETPWDDLELVIPREAVKERAKTILLADESESSPFPYKGDLFKTLKFSFPEYRVERLSEIKLGNIKDFLPLLDAAACIVTIDTAFLHLSKATTTPVIALAYDGENRWRGSAWSKRFALCLRYSEYEARKDELVRMVGQAVNNSGVVLKLPIPTKQNHGYNLSITELGRENIITFRHHPEKGKWRTDMAIDDGRQVWPIQFPDELKSFSIEDGKMFWHGERLMLSYVTSAYPSTPARCAMGYGPLLQDEKGWKVAAHIQPKYSTNDLSALQKNWLFYSHNSKLYAVYGSEPQQTILELDGDRVVAEHKSTSPKWAYGEIRGGAIAPHKNGLLRFFHSVSGDRLKYHAFRYHIGALLMEPKPPFKVIAISKYPIISGHEGWTPDCAHWKPNVVFPGGLILRGDEWSLGYGENDCACKLATGTYEQLNFEPYAQPVTQQPVSVSVPIAPVANQVKSAPRGTWVTR